MSAENKKGEFLMKRFTVVLSIVLLSMSGLFAAAINSPAATVYLTKTTVISMDQLNAKVKSYQDAYTAQGQDPTKVDTMDVLNTMVNDELFRQGAARDKVIITDSMIDQAYNQVKSQYNAAGATDDQFVQVINRTYGSIQAYRDLLRDQLLVQQYLLSKEPDIINAAVTVTDAEIQTAYRRNKAQLVLPENVKISHIYIPFDKDSAKDAQNKATLEQVAKKLKAGSLSFEQAVTQYSQDTDSKDKAGDIGWLTVDNTQALQSLGQTFVDTAFSTPVGSTSDVVVSNSGYHIIKILAHNDAKILALDDKTGPDTTQTVREYLKAQLQSTKQQENYQKAINALLADLHKQATIKILYSNK
jgi:parvulin-like peptidyl-prolyl isomerase